MSSTQRIANEFDMELFRLMSKADRLASDSRIKSEADAWAKVGGALSAIRPEVRAMMHIKDLARTNSNN